MTPRLETQITSQTVLKAEGISKSFTGVKALKDISVEIYAGRVNAIVGENGAGKPTLMKILAGVYQDYEGQLYLDGRAASFANPREAQERGIAIIHQELNLIDGLSAAENIFLGREFLSRTGLIDYAAMNAEAERLLHRLGLEIDPRTPVGELRVGQQQIVEIAKALSLNARILIMDEPTSAVSDQEVEVLFALISELKRQGVAVVYITHKLDELFRIGDDVTVLRDGRLIASRPLRGLTQDDVVKMMVGRDLGGFFVKDHQPSGEILLRVENLSLEHPERPGAYVFRNVSFDLKRGEVLGIFGLMGAGRTELLETLVGLHPNRSSGRILIQGREADIRSPEQAAAFGIGLAPEDRKADGLVLNMSVAENVTLASLQKAVRHGVIRSAAEQRLAEEYVQKLAIKTPSTRQIVENLSGGNQQKVVLAKWLAADPRVLLLDEPTRGIDVGAKNEIYRLINQLAKDGLGIIMVSSELPEILAIADRILVLARGGIAGEFIQSEATEEKLLKAAVTVN